MSMRIVDLNDGKGWHVLGEMFGKETTVFSPKPEVTEPWTRLALCNRWVAKQSANAPTES